jgi:hypothetical protein
VRNASLLQVHGAGRAILLTAPHGIPLERENCLHLDAKTRWKCAGAYKSPESHTTAIVSRLAAAAGPLAGEATALVWQRDRAALAVGVNVSLRDPNFMLPAEAAADRWHRALARSARVGWPPAALEPAGGTPEEALLPEALRPLLVSLRSHIISHLGPALRYIC